jgi:hypothetical protein
VGSVSGWADCSWWIGVLSIGCWSLSRAMAEVSCASKSGTEVESSLGEKLSLNRASSSRHLVALMLKSVGEELYVALGGGGLEECRRALGMLGEEEATIVSELSAGAKFLVYLPRGSLG